MVRRDSGYNLVVLAVTITVMTIAVATALPSWSGAIRREKEEELIFRGLQMAEGIRVFQRRFGRLPATLDELLKAEPRSLRQEWKDPMTEDGAWAIITAQEMQNTQGGAGQGGQGGQSGRGSQGGQTDDGRDGAQPGGQQAPPTIGPDGQPIQGPVAGVRSKSRERAFKTFDGADNYGNWRFTHDLVQPGSLGRGRMQGGVVGSNVGGRGGAASRLAIPNANWIGRPFREGLTPGGAALQGGTGPNDNKKPTVPTPPGGDDDEGDDGGGGDG